jgi:hypothetical protein
MEIDFGVVCYAFSFGVICILILIQVSGNRDLSARQGETVSTLIDTRALSA